jgi:hypothetical protein
MAIQGCYYLHTNGDLIYKPHAESAADIRESNFARGLWFVDPADREGAWTILVESLAAGANKARVMELAEKWKCGDTDAHEYASRIGVKLERDGNAWHAMAPGHINLQESPNGFGDTCLEAMATLAKELRYEPATMWGTSFKQLLTAPPT